MAICSISGNPTTDPVLSPASGNIFDRNLIQSYIEQEGKDPINGKPLTLEDLIQVNEPEAAVIPAPNNLTSIPNLLSQFQKEWDALAIELFTLRKQLKQSREELSVLLYHQDAAVRVAAKAVEERDAARKALEELAESIAKGDVEQDDQEVEQVQEEADENIPSSISESLAFELQSAHSELFSIHKANKKKPSYSPDSEISLHVEEFFDLQTVIKDLKGFKTARISSVSVNPQDSQKRLISFDNSHAIVYDFQQSQVLQVLSPKKRNLVSSTWLSNGEEGSESSAVLAFADGSIYIDDKLVAKSSNNSGKLVKVISHPVLDLLIVVHANSLKLYKGQDQLVFERSVDFTITALDLHGDGLLLALGDEDGSIHIYDISKGTEISTLFQDSEALLVSKLFFADNGYWLVSQVQDTVKVIDLRKEFVVAEIENHQFVALDLASQLLYLLPTNSTEEDQIQLTYLRYFKKLKNFQLSSDEPLLIDHVTKIKKGSSTEIVAAFNDETDSLQIVENSNLFKRVLVK